MDSDRLLLGVAHDIECWAEDALAQLAHEMEAEARVEGPGDDDIVLACVCGVRWVGWIPHQAAQTLTRNWHLVHCGPGHHHVS
jgi:hypothetical protein